MNLFHPQGYIPKVGDYVGGINIDSIEPAQIVSIEDYRFHVNTGGYFHRNHFKDDSSSGIRVYQLSPYVNRKQPEPKQYPDYEIGHDLPPNNNAKLPEQLIPPLEDAGLEIKIDHNNKLTFVWANNRLAVKPSDCGREADTVSIDPLLAEAQHKVRGDRQESYGDKVRNFTDIAKLQGVIIDVDKSASDVALEMICLKLARLLKSPDHYDTLVDMVGYILCYVDIRKTIEPEIYAEAETRFSLESRK